MTCPSSSARAGGVYHLYGRMPRRPRRIKRPRSARRSSPVDMMTGVRGNLLRTSRSSSSSVFAVIAGRSYPPQSFPRFLLPPPPPAPFLLLPPPSLPPPPPRTRLCQPNLSSPPHPPPSPSPTSSSSSTGFQASKLMESRARSRPGESSSRSRAQAGEPNVDVQVEARKISSGFLHTWMGNGEGTIWGQLHEESPRCFHDPSLLFVVPVAEKLLLQQRSSVPTVRTTTAPSRSRRLGGHRHRTRIVEGWRLKNTGLVTAAAKRDRRVRGSLDEQMLLEPGELVPLSSVAWVFIIPRGPHSSFSTCPAPPRPCTSVYPPNAARRLHFHSTSNSQNAIPSDPVYPRKLQGAASEVAGLEGPHPTPAFRKAEGVDGEQLSAGTTGGGCRGRGGSREDESLFDVQC
ncbi:hypothetical protein GALMADRAFT_132756 [Galerina marginata CBS 339.88]|uniref:Uncharacterized protein n=1 Tax=Galerina marginata (strain CBS 339.88) TaxID=685588 RepID=A0A067U3Z4_GALM3|nr:hypothetical protein GALMADRAFT_132756 [Galerina marginata CBS 339.88]